MLVASCKQTDCEDLLYDIMILFLLISDRKYKRSSYFKMVKMCIMEIAFGDSGYGPEFEIKKVIFKKPLGKIEKFFLFDILEESLQQIEIDNVPSRLSMRLEAAITAKQEAIVNQTRYYQKMNELKNENLQLRKHVNLKLK